MNEAGRRSVQCVQHTFAILDFLSSESGANASLREIGDHVGVHKATASRLLATMEAAGVVERNEVTKAYRPSLGLVIYAGRVLRNLEIPRIAVPVLRNLADVSHETVNLAMRHRNSIVNVEQIPGPSVLRIVDAVGQISPLHQGAAGLALLAHLPEAERSRYLSLDGIAHTDCAKRDLVSEVLETQKRGYAVNRGELNPDIRAIGAPVFNGRGRCLATVSVVGDSSMLDDDRVSVLATQVVDSARAISRQLGYAERGNP